VRDDDGRSAVFHTKTAVEADERRASLLARYEADGLTQREIGACIKLSQKHVDCLLRYRRFLSATCTQIMEGTFRAYWQQVRDPPSDTRQTEDRC
jgi:hypothetical protein